MSITDEIQERIKVHRGKHLFYLPMATPGDAHLRTMIVSVEVRDAVIDDLPKNWEGKRRGEFRGALDAFTSGEYLSVAEKPFDKPPDADIARVHPVKDEIWDIRSTNPQPGIRCFGGFGGKDLFIALTWNYREDIYGKDDWEYEIDRCKADWDRLFDPLTRFKGASPNEYLSKFYAV